MVVEQRNCTAIQGVNGGGVSRHFWRAMWGALCGNATRDESLVLAMLNDLDIASLHAIRDWMAGDQTAAQIPWPSADLDWTTQEWRHWSAQVSP